MGLWNDYFVICIKINNFKSSEKYDRFYGIYMPYLYNSIMF